ncbi:MAG: SocA family protein [Gemmataceae bacterium]|nr:SocA family protein [Gemmataceae bacterium]
MNFPLDVAKVIQAIGVLFREDGVQSMNYMRLLKLLYIADREAILETEQPIVGGPFIAMERGPVLEEVYDLIRGQHTDMPLWGDFLETKRYNIELIQKPDVKKLSRYEIKKLQDVSRRYIFQDEWDLAKITHEFPEWIKNNPGSSSRKIPLDDILDALEIAESKAAIVADTQESAGLRRDLANAAAMVHHK